MWLAHAYVNHLQFTPMTLTIALTGSSDIKPTTDLTTDDVPPEFIPVKKQTKFSKPQFIPGNTTDDVPTEFIPMEKQLILSYL